MPAVPVDGKSSALDNSGMSAEPSALVGLRYRRDFLAAAKARKAVTDGFILQNRTRNDGLDVIRVGFTASKKVGNAVIRNRSKRRLRELARKMLPKIGTSGCDYVLIARKTATIELPFEKLRADLAHAIERCHPSVKR